LAQFYFDRGDARAQLGRLKEAIADANKALEVGRGAVPLDMMVRLQQQAGLQYAAAGDPKQAFAIFSQQLRDANAPGARGIQFNGNRQIAAILVQMGDIAQADTFLRRNLSLIEEARTSGLPGWRKSYALLGQSWEADVEHTRAIVFEARGQFREAEASYALTERRRRAALVATLHTPNPPPEDQVPTICRAASTATHASDRPGAFGPH
jgi:tetratricopeptide (TPR) repeat protein